MTLSEYVESICGLRIAVIGLGVSNMPLVELLLRGGCDVTACDLRTREQLGEEAARLEAMGAKLRLGEDYLEGLDQELIFRTPGLMPFDGHLVAAAERGAVVTSEMEVFLSLCPCRVIAVTGSDGKTTTSTILSELLKAAGYRVHLGGNIGNPLLCETPDILPDDIAVLELSSFQLHSMVCAPDIAVVTNVTPNHLDKHKDFQDYIDAKRAILEHQSADARLVLNLDDEHSAYLEGFSKAHKVWFSDRGEVAEGSMLRGGVLCRVHGGAVREILHKDEIKLPGEHNVLNYLAAFAATEGLVGDDVCAAVAKRFAGVEHRLELVRELGGVQYINDSIGSTPTRTIAGLHAMRVKPIVIAGGYDKHIPFDTLGDELCLYAKELFLTGDTAEKIRDAVQHSAHYAKSGLEIHMETDLRKTIHDAAAAAKAGDIVLFSPACASFDHFRNFAERGRFFKSVVWELDEKNDNGGGA
ncbi:MAG: UDP-N-acetylmuramoyl-L-alanine--D-glutamate ligase [Oscillospiraceae bacterium]|nr:UDP-N-acetylmuramoyl-L-alanine--D-glutamate ligase [Oscillospiraceae bacterium]